MLYCCVVTTKEITMNTSSFHILKLQLGLLIVLCHTAAAIGKMSAVPDKPLRILPKVRMEEPDEELLRWARDNIHEDPDKRAQIIEELRDLIFERGQCVPVRLDDEFLLKFLRARNFIVKLAHKLLVNYTSLADTTLRLSDVDFDKITELVQENVFSVPPYVDQDGRRILIVRLGEWDTSRFTTDELFQLIMIIFHIALMEPNFQILGGQCILDLTDVSLGHTWYMSPTVAQQLIQIAFRAMPVRIKAIHMINTSWFFDKVFGILKPFLTDFMKGVIYFHDDLEGLHQHIDPKHLPTRYGGIHEDYTFGSWIASLKDNEPVISELESLGYHGCREAIQNFVLKQEPEENEDDREEL